MVISYSFVNSLSFANQKEGDSAISEIKKDLEERIAVLPGGSNLKLEYDIGYNPEEFRDPFTLPPIFQEKIHPPQNLLTPSTPVQDPIERDVILMNPFNKYFVMEYRLKAIMWGVTQPKAVVVAPQGEVLTIGLGYRLGREGGVVWKIKEGEVVILIPDAFGDFKNARHFSLTLKEK